MTDAAWITPAYPWEGDPVTGVFYQTYARAVASHGYGLTVASPVPWAPWPIRDLRASWRRYSAAPRRAADGSVRVVRPRYMGVPGEPDWARPDRFIARAAWRDRSSWFGARVIHGHSAVTGLAAWRLADRAGLPLALTFHGSDLNIWPDRHPHRVADLRMALRSASFITTVSAALAARVEVIAGVPSTVLPIGSNHRVLAAEALPRDEARKRLGILDDRIVVLFVGNLVEAKGVRALADAIVATGDGFVGIFVGQGPLIGHGADTSPGSRQLRYVGPRPHNEVAGYLSAADVLVLPSHREGLPTILVEAGSLGIPVIASGVGGIPALLGDDRGAVLPDVSPSAIQAALLVFETHRPEADAAAARLRSFVYAEHDADVNAERLIDLYRSAAAR